MVRGKIRFWGDPAAELFTQEIAASFQGVIDHNMVTDPTDPMLGFISASIDGRPWTDTMWTRDAGVFLRELVQWGDLEHAGLVAKNLIHLVRKNPEGYFTFPEHFQRRVPASGSELDGTAAIILSLVLLWERLPETHPTCRIIEIFLTERDSPLNYLIHRLEHNPLVAGSGEFGGGMGFTGEFYNVVQNALARLALLAAARMACRMGKLNQVKIYSETAGKISENMLKYLRGDDGDWLWAVNSDSLQPDPLVLNNIYNKGTGGLNGVLSMWSDVLGFTPLDSDWEGIEPCLLTFTRLFDVPKRKAMFEKYGAWTQFDDLWEGYLTSPSYGHGYATQAMLLMDRLDMAERAIGFLAYMTFLPFCKNDLDRESPYFFYERCYLPELAEAWTSLENKRGEQPAWIAEGFDGKSFDQGCGALNLVNVAEPLKIARLIMGIDDSNPNETRWIPRLLPSWQGMSAENWPILTSKGLIYVDMLHERRPERLYTEVTVHDGQSLTCLAMRLKGEEDFIWTRNPDVEHLVIE